MKYTLQPYTTPSSRYQCPQCNHRNKTFVRYINTETGQHLANHVGRCGRENNCGYHFAPRQYFEGEGSVVHKPWTMAGKERTWQRKKNHRPSTMDHGPELFHCINPEIVNASFAAYNRNNFVQYLINRFGFDMADKLVGRYRIGTSKHWPGATVFWQLDKDGKVRTGKVMLYNPETGKRVKKPFSHITWAHTLLSQKSGVLSRESEVLNQKSDSGLTQDLELTTQDPTIKQCLFGEHLLNQIGDRGIAIVESEKTAIIASAHNDSFIWLASGSISNLNAQLCQPLKGRHVTLYPDLGAYDKWKAKALQLQAAIPSSTFSVSHMLEDMASDEDRDLGLDLGDFL